MEESGRILGLFMKTLTTAFTPPLRLRNLFKQMEEVGVRSFPVVLITASFTGAVLALQSFSAFKRFHAESMMGSLVALSMTRELGPVITGLIVAGRVGSAMAAELGTMRVTEQIDALTTLAVNPVKYLVVPRFLATTIMMPLLVIMADGLGIFGGYLVGTSLLGVNPVVYMNSTWIYLDFEDVYGGLFKALFFGMIISIISCYKGFYTQGGAEGVGKATTAAVVVSMMLILISDYFLTALLL
ncbi:ABC transporter permease [bacterium]|nr:ABC transporter permease [candidate division CSSED10-310 bacterium]